MEGEIVAQPGRSRAVIAAVVLAVVVHLPGITGAFLTWDDALYVTNNPRVQEASLRGLLRVWDPSDALAGRFIEYFPLRDTLYLALHGAFGEWPPPYHATILFLHACATYLVWRVARRIGLSDRAALFASLLFAVHPVHVESVVWIAALKDPMYACCFCIVVDRHLRWRDEGPYKHLAMSHAALAVGFLVKSLMCVIPGVVMLAELAFRRVSKRELVIGVLGYGAISAAFIALIIQIAHANDVVAPYHGGTIWTAVMTAVVYSAIYLSKTILPVDLCAFYVIDPVLSPLDWRFLISGSIFAALAVISVRRDRAGDRIHQFTLLWFIACLIPVLNIIPMRLQIADRYLYIPSIGVCLWCGVMLGRLAERHLRLAVGVAFFWLATFSVLSAQQSLIWTDEEALWRQVLEQPQGGDRAQPLVALGDVLQLRGRTAEALALYLQAADTTDARAKPDASAALLLLGRGDLASARTHAARALARNPEADLAWLASSKVKEAEGDLRGAAAALARVAELAPLNATARWNLALLRMKLGDLDGAAQAMADALRVSPALCERFWSVAPSMRASVPAAAARFESVASVACPSAAAHTP